MNGTISILPKHRRQVMNNLLSGFTITVVGLSGVEQIREDLVLLGEDRNDVNDPDWLFFEEIEDGMFEVQI